MQSANECRRETNTETNVDKQAAEKSIALKQTCFGTAEKITKTKPLGTPKANH